MSSAAESVRRYSRFFKTQHAMDVLDYGTGSMRNALYLAQEGFSVYAADLPEQVEKLRDCPALLHIERLLGTDELSRSNLNVDVVLSTYVFNIIMDSTERHTYLENAAANLKPGGYLLMEVRCRKPHEQCSATCKDFFSHAECSKTFSHNELDTLMNPHGLRRISHYYRSHAVVAVYQKAQE
jgi:cyclopropane fatty-acyl-phospholipid synthase-like methyltransferase